MSSWEEREDVGSFWIAETPKDNKIREQIVSSWIKEGEEEAVIIL